MSTYTLSDGVTADVGSTLLGDYSFAGEVEAASDVSTIQLGAGLGYALLFVGQSGSGVYVAPDPGAAAGWAREPHEGGGHPDR